jgi:hypothetical protein
MIDSCCFGNWLRQNNGNAFRLDTVDLLHEGTGFTNAWLAVIEFR